MKLIRIFINNLDDKRENFHFVEDCEFDKEPNSLIDEYIMAYRRVHYDLYKIKYFKNGNINLYFNEF